MNVNVLLALLVFMPSLSAHARNVLQGHNFVAVPRAERFLQVEPTRAHDCLEVRTSYGYGQPVTPKELEKLSVRQRVNPVSDEDTIETERLSAKAEKTFFPLVYRLKQRPLHGTAAEFTLPDGDTFGGWLDRVYEGAPGAKDVRAIVRLIPCPEAREKR